MHIYGGTRWRSWLKHCATNRKVEDSIPDGVTGIFRRHYAPSSTTALVSTQNLIEMSIEIFPGDKNGRCLGLTTLAPSRFDYLAICGPQTPEFEGFIQRFQE